MEGKKTKNKTKLPREEHVACVVQEYYSDLEGLRDNDPVMKETVKLGKCCYDKQVKNQFEITVLPKFCNPEEEGMLLPPKLERLCATSIDIRGSLKACLPHLLFKAQTMFLYNNWWS